MHPTVQYSWSWSPLSNRYGQLWVGTLGSDASMHRSRTCALQKLMSRYPVPVANRDEGSAQREGQHTTVRLWTALLNSDFTNTVITQYHPDQHHTRHPPYAKASCKG